MQKYSKQKGRNFKNKRAGDVLPGRFANKSWKVIMVVLVALGVAWTLVSLSQSRAAVACTGIVVNPGDNIQNMVNANPEGTVYCIKAGVHREQKINKLKNRIQFIGEPGAVLSGAKLLTNFSRDGVLWVASGQTQQNWVRAITCDSDAPRCGYPEELYINDQPLRHVGSKADVVPGKWFFDYDTDKIYFSDDPTGRIVETSSTNGAIQGLADDVVIKNLVIEKYANQAQFGAIEIGLQNQDIPAQRWIIDNVESRLNHGVGVRFNLAHDSILRNSKVSSNGQMGFGGIGNNILIENNEVAYNNFAGVGQGWEAGGSKMVRTDGLIVRGNHVHHNRGPGLWTDANNIRVTYEDNLIEDNEQEGIFQEIGYDMIVRNNTIKRNGHGRGAWCYGTGILIAHSSNAEVYNNTLEDNWNGIVGIDQNRGTGHHGPWELRNLHVYNNKVTYTQNYMRDSSGNGVIAAGVCQDFGNTDIFTTRNNRFENNQYFVPDTAGGWFAWANGRRTFSAWQGFNHDTTGSISKYDSTVTPPPPATKPGDLNGDGSVNGLDLSTVLANYNKTNQTRAQGDLNGDGAVNGLDLSQVLANYGK